MKKAQNIIIRPPVKAFHSGGTAYSKPMVSALLLRRIHNKGINLEETPLDVLGLGAMDKKEIEQAGIVSLKQLAAMDDSDVRAIPHFGIIKVRRLKIKLKSILSAMLNDPNPKLKPPADLPKPVIIDPLQAGRQIRPASLNEPSESELERFYKTLDKLERRLGSLESKFARIIKR